MNLKAFKESGHWPTLLTSFLYFDFSFMVWTLLGALGGQIGETLHLSAGQKGLMVATPLLAGAFFRLVLGVLVDRIGAKRTGIAAQVIVLAGMLGAWLHGLNNFSETIAMGLVLGIAGASFAVALPQVGRWYPPKMQGAVMGIAGAGNVGVVLDHLIAPKLAEYSGWPSVFGWGLIPGVLVLVVYVLMSKEAPAPAGGFKKKTFADYWNLLREKDAHWFCFYYTLTFGGFVGLASYYALYFQDPSLLHFSKVKAGLLAAMCTMAGALARPVGGFLADRFGGIRTLSIFYAIAAAALIGCAFIHQGTPLPVVMGLFLVISAAFGCGNGSVFQLLPLRFGKDIGVMSGLVGCGGGVGGFIFAAALGLASEKTGSYAVGFLGFAALCAVAMGALTLVKTRWRTTWGAAVDARI